MPAAGLADNIAAIGGLLLGLAALITAVVGGVASLRKAHRKLDEINDAVNNVDKDVDPRPLWRRIDDLSDQVVEVRSAQATTHVILDRIVERRAIDGKAVRDLSAALVELADLKDVIADTKDQK